MSKWELIKFNPKRPPCQPFFAQTSRKDFQCLVVGRCGPGHPAERLNLPKRVHCFQFPVSNSIIASMPPEWQGPPPTAATRQISGGTIALEILGIDIGGSGIKGAPVNINRGRLTGERHRIPTPSRPHPKPWPKWWPRWLPTLTGKAPSAAPSRPLSRTESSTAPPTWTNPG